MIKIEIYKFITALYDLFCLITLYDVLLIVDLSIQTNSYKKITSLGLLEFSLESQGRRLLSLYNVIEFR